MDLNMPLIVLLIYILLRKQTLSSPTHHPHNGSQWLGSRGSRSGQAAQLPEGSQWPQPADITQEEGELCGGGGDGNWWGCQLNLLLQEWKRHKTQQERIKLQTKSASKEKRGAKGKQAEVADQETKDLPAANRETKNEESPVSDEGEKEARSD